MSCILTSGYALPCRTGQGGTKKKYIGTYSGSTTWTVDSGGVITGATGYNKFFEFVAMPETILLTEPAEHSRENFTTVVTQTLTSKLYSTTQTDRDLANLLAQSAVFVITEDNNGNFFLVGKENGMWMTASEASAGQTMNDPNHISFTFESRGKYFATQVNSALIATLTA
jgi:hypothetical protein